MNQLVNLASISDMNATVISSVYEGKAAGLHEAQLLGINILPTGLISQSLSQTFSKSVQSNIGQANSLDSASALTVMVA